MVFDRLSLFMTVAVALFLLVIFEIENIVLEVLVFCVKNEWLFFLFFLDKTKDVIE